MNKTILLPILLSSLATLCSSSNELPWYVSAKDIEAEIPMQAPAYVKNLPEYACLNKIFDGSFQEVLRDQRNVREEALPLRASKAKAYNHCFRQSETAPLIQESTIVLDDGSQSSELFLPGASVAYPICKWPQQRAYDYTSFCRAIRYLRACEKNGGRDFLREMEQMEQSN